MLKITNDGLIRSGTGCLQLYPHGNSGRQRVILDWLVSHRVHGLNVAKRSEV